ncbi:MAG: hypothetical protein FWH14_08310 [Oscillospiraceae bacterium]|nr:hypothetical protein [Oscillospiraceae bacterium]
MKKLISMFCAVAVFGCGVIGAFDLAWSAEATRTDGFGVSYYEEFADDGGISDEPVGADVTLNNAPNTGVYRKSGITVRNPFIYRNQFTQDGGTSRNNFSDDFKNHLEIEVIVGGVGHRVPAANITLTRQQWTPADFYDRPHVQGNAAGTIQPQSGNHWFTVTTTGFLSGDTYIPNQSVPLNFAITVTANADAPKVRPVAIANGSDHTSVAVHEFTRYSSPNPQGTVWGSSFDTSNTPSFTRSADPTAYKFARTSSTGGGWLVASNEPYHVELSMYKYLYVEIDIEGASNAPYHIRIDNNNSTNPTFDRASFYDTMPNRNRAGIGCYDLSRIGSYTSRFFMNLVCDGISFSESPMIIAQFWLSNEPLFLGSSELGVPTATPNEKLEIIGLQRVSMPAKIEYRYGGGLNSAQFEEVSLDGAIYNAALERTIPSLPVSERVQLGYMENVGELITINNDYKNRIHMNSTPEHIRNPIPTKVDVELRWKNQVFTDSIDVYYYQNDPVSYRAANNHSETRRVYLTSRSVTAGGVAVKSNGSVEFYGASGSSVFGFESGHDYLTSGGNLNMDPSQGGYRYLYVETSGNAMNMWMNSHNNSTNYGRNVGNYREFTFYREDFCVNGFTGLTRFDASNLSTNVGSLDGANNIKQITQITFNAANDSTITGVWVSNHPYLINPPGASETREIADVTILRNPQSELIYSTSSGNAGMNFNYASQFLGVKSYGLDYAVDSDGQLSRYRLGVGLVLDDGSVFDIAKDENATQTLSIGTFDTTQTGVKEAEVRFTHDGIDLATYVRVNVVENLDGTPRDYGPDTVKLSLVPFNFGAVNQYFVFRHNGEIMIYGAGGGNDVWLDTSRADCPVHATCSPICPERPSKHGYDLYKTEQYLRIASDPVIALNLDRNGNPIYDVTKMRRPNHHVPHNNPDPLYDYTLVDDSDLPISITWGNPDQMLISGKGFPATKVHNILRSQYPAISGSYYKHEYDALEGVKYTNSALSGRPYIDISDYKYMYLDVEGPIHHIRINGVDDHQNAIGMGESPTGPRLHGSQLNGWIRVSTETMARTQALTDDNRAGHVWTLNLVAPDSVYANLKGVYLSNNSSLNPYLTIGNPTGGGTVTVRDILATRDHIIGTERLTDPDQLWAADANEDGVINIFDMLVMRDVILR